MHRGAYWIVRMLNHSQSDKRIPMAICSVLVILTALHLNKERFETGKDEISSIANNTTQETVENNEFLDVSSSEFSSKPDWWNTALIYQVYPRSFQDSDGDGVGDIKGIISRIDYLLYLGVDAVWINPMYQSPMMDFGYDVTNHTQIDPLFGTNADLDQLIQILHENGLKIIIDFIPNHTSEQHMWFQESLKGGTTNPYSDFYVWHQGRLDSAGKRIPPNNWINKLASFAWTWSDQRQAFYYHRFMKEQPDLNWRNPQVLKFMTDVLMHWVHKDVDAFRVDGITNLFEGNYDQDEPLKSPDLPKDEFLSYNHNETKHQPEIHDVIRHWRHLLDKYENRTGKHIALFPEAYDDQKFTETMKYYRNGADMPLNFNFIYGHPPNCSARCLHQIVNGWLEHMPEDKWPNYMTGSHDMKRITTRKGKLYADVYNMMLLTLPGSVITFQGEELAMEDIQLTFEETLDHRGKAFGHERYKKFSRDPSRAPMQWNTTKNSGFSSGDSTWLPLHWDYINRNVEVMMHSNTTNSLKLYKQVARLRKTPSFWSNKIIYCKVTDEIFSYVRPSISEGNSKSYLIILNVGYKTVEETYSDCSHVTQFGVSMVTTPNLGNEAMTPGLKVSLSSLTLKPGDGIIIELDK